MSDRCHRHEPYGHDRGFGRIRGRCALPNGRTARYGAGAALAAAGRPTPLQGPLGRFQPVSLAIPKIGMNAPLAAAGTGPSGRIEAPALDEPNLARWRERGASPGEPGAAVIAGLARAETGSAVFARLGELTRGDIVGVVRANETVAVFRVTVTGRAFEHDVPAGCADGGAVPELCLIACAGRIDDARCAHPDHLVVHGSFAAAYRVSDLLRT
ncbi:class F sortase [Actinomadura fulvescens]|uniref:Uncharacterized protein n=1 Tax=Actinomadura fulvescens TaxID=46160 RepID=A0ABN3QS14_9ACTN